MGVFEFRVATEFNVVKVKVTDEGMQHIDKMTAAGCCLGCEEPLQPDDRPRRGLCSTCYAGVMHAVRKHGASEKSLMEKGRLLKAKPGGRKPKNKFTASLTGRESDIGAKS